MHAQPTDAFASVPIAQFYMAEFIQIRDRLEKLSALVQSVVNLEKSASERKADTEALFTRVGKHTEEIAILKSRVGVLMGVCVALAVGFVLPLIVFVVTKFISKDETRELYYREPPAYYQSYVPEDYRPQREEPLRDRAR